MIENRISKFEDRTTEVTPWNNKEKIDLKNHEQNNNKLSNTHTTAVLQGKTIIQLTIVKEIMKYQNKRIANNKFSILKIAVNIKGEFLNSLTKAS